MASPSAAKGPGVTVVLTGTAVFLGAFLLFLVQPILAKLILPRFGGSVAVWATCLVFFQAALLAGYAFAHQVVRRGTRAWRLAHGVLLLGSLALLPIVPSFALVEGTLPPALQILALLVLTIGLPFTLLAMTSPLLQAWLAHGPPRSNPYRLFAVSNLASLAALLCYPWLIEPWLRTALQAQLWSVAYAAYALLLCLISLRQPAQAAATAAAPGQAAAIGWPRWAGWFALAALGSYELVAVTNHLTQNIPSFPMMWVLPLVLYLASFTLCFDSDRWTAPRPWRVAALLALLLMCALLLFERQIKVIAWQVAGFLVALFVVCMFCHGELARSRPPAARLTQFYLAVSAGGVAGGALVALGAPLLLRGYFEVELGLVLLALALLWRCLGDAASARAVRVRAAAGALVLLATLATGVQRVDDTLSEVIAISRNFFGVLRVRQYGSEAEPKELERVLIHGRVMHGQQFLAEERRRQPTSYYTETSGVGRLLQSLNGRRIDVGAVGLGAGTIATYGKVGDVYRFYEIDPAIVDAARRWFSFIADSGATVEVAVGDGRLLLQAEGERRFDVLVVDAFSGDSIPVHLLTREAVALYLQRLKPDGVIALHISNSHLNLKPVAARIAADLQLHSVLVADLGVEGDVSRSVSDWVLLARERAPLDAAPIREVAQPMAEPPPGRTWTDDFSNIVELLSFGRRTH